MEHQNSVLTVEWSWKVNSSIQAKLKELNDILSVEENRIKISNKLYDNKACLHYFELMYHLLKMEVVEGKLKPKGGICQK